MYRIFINSEEVDVDSNTFIPINYQIYRLDDLTSILSNYTKTINLPRTNNNDRIFKFASSIESKEPLSLDYFDCTVVKNGIEVISNGKGRVLSFSKSGFQIQIMFGNYNLLNDIENKKLTDIVTSDIDHDWNYANIVASSFQGNCFTKDYIYPLIEWGNGILNSFLSNGEVTESTYINLEMLLPCIKARYILDKIISEAGYTLNPDSEDVLSLIEDFYIPLVNLKGDSTTLYQMSQASAIAVDYYGEAGKMVIGSDRIIAVDLGSDAIQLNYFTQMKRIMYFGSETIVNPPDPPYHESYYFSAYRVGVTGTIGVHASITFLIDDPGAFTADTKFQICVCSGSFLEHIRENGEETENHEFSYTVLSETTFPEEELFEYEGNYYWRYSVALRYVGRFIPSDYIFLVIDYEWKSEEGATVLIKDGSLECDHIVANGYDEDENIIETTGYGYRLPININLPDVTQAEFLKSLFAKRNLIIATNQFDKLITIKKFDDVFNNISLAKDWSDKLDLTDGFTLEYTLDGFYKRNWFKYQERKVDKNVDSNKSNVASGYFDIDNKFLETSDAYRTSMFNETDTEVKTMHSLVIPKIKFMNLNYGVLESLPRILMIKQTDETEYPNDVETPLTYETLLEATSFNEEVPFSRGRAFFVAADDPTFVALVGDDDLHFQNILNNHYPKIINMLQNYKRIICKFNLNEADIAGFDHFIPVWVSAFKSYFYINSIRDYVDGLTEVELIKLY